MPEIASHVLHHVTPCMQSTPVFRQWKGPIMKLTRHFISASFKITALACAAFAAPALAQGTFPDRAVRIILPGPPGNVTDTMTRLVAKSMSEQFGQPVVVDNRPGGATIIATDAVVKSKPDGYTLLLVSAPFVTNPGLYDKLPYDSLRDLDPVVLLSENGFLFAVNSGTPYKTLKEVADASRTLPGGISYASPGIGTVMHLAGQLFNKEYGTKFVNVAYKGSAQAGQDVAGGHVPMIIDPITTTLPLIRGGKLRPLAVTHATRQPELPDVPTVRELGFEKLETRSFSGFLVPAGTPRDVILKLNGAINKAIADPNIRKTVPSQHMVGGTPEAFAAMLRTETERWVPLIRQLGIKPQ